MTNVIYGYILDFSPAHCTSAAWLAVWQRIL